jgi:hypothetical protein
VAETFRGRCHLNVASVDGPASSKTPVLLPSWRFERVRQFDKEMVQHYDENF